MQAGGVLQAAGEAQHAAACWLGQVQAGAEGGEQLMIRTSVKQPTLWFLSFLVSDI